MNAPQLPFQGQEAAFLQLVSDHQVVVLSAPTGTGKSSLAPLAMLNAGMAEGGRIGVTVPRRPAARNLGRWVAKLHGTAFGHVVGYQIGQDNQAYGCDLVYMTDGILLAQMRSDPLLHAYKVIVLDEVHDRGINQDLLIALMKNVLPQRPDLKLVLMSATLDQDKFSEHYGGAPVLHVPGRTFAVEVRHAQSDVSSLAQMLECCTQKVCEILRGPEPGDILVFLPDPQTINTVVRGIETQMGNAPNLVVLPLHGAQSREEQARIYERDGRRRVIVATNIAETSLTIDGLTHVVDTGLVKQTVYIDASMSALQITEHSRAGCEQRKGRVGRTRRGICHRLYTQQSYEDRVAFTVPEIKRTSLDQVLLKLRCLGFSHKEILALPLMDHPQELQWEQASDRLKILGALDAHGNVTHDGRRMDRMNVSPVTGRMILEGHARGCLAEVIVIAATLEAGRSLFVRPKDKEAEADAAHAAFMVAGSDPMTNLNVWLKWRQNGSGRGWARQKFLSSRTLEATDRIRAQLLKTVEREGMELSHARANPDVVQRAVAAGLIINLAMQRGRSTYQWKGKETYIFPGSALASLFTSPKLLVCVKVLETSRAFMRGCQVVQPQWLDELLPPSACTHTWKLTNPLFGDSTVLRCTKSFNGTVILEEDHDVFPEGVEVPLAALLTEHILAGYSRVHPDMDSLRRAWRLVRESLGIDPWSTDVSDEHRQALVEMLGAQVEGVSSVSALVHTPLSFDYARFLDTERFATQIQELSEEQDRLRHSALQRLRETEQKEALRAQRKKQLDALDARMEALGIDLEKSGDWDERWFIQSLHRGVEPGAYMSISELDTKLRTYAAKVASAERRGAKRLAFTDKIRNAVREQFPVCPACGTEWSQNFTCNAHSHDPRQFVTVTDRGAFRIGRFMTDRAEEVARLSYSGTALHVQFMVSEGSAWKGKVFKTIIYQPDAEILPSELVDQHDEIQEMLEELRTLKEAAQASAAQLAQHRSAHPRKEVGVHRFSMRGGQPVVRRDGQTFAAEFADVWPADGDQWFCWLEYKSASGQGVARLIGPADDFTTEEDVEDIRELLRESYAGIPESLLA